MSIQISPECQDSFVKKNQLVIDYCFCPTSQCFALLSFLPLTETYQLSLNFPEMNYQSFADVYCWKSLRYSSERDTNLDERSSFSSLKHDFSGYKQGSFLYWNVLGNKIMVFIENHLQIFTLTYFHTLSNRIILFPDVLYLIKASYDDCQRNSMIFQLNSFLSLQWTITTNTLKHQGNHFSVINDMLFSLIQETGFLLIDWNGTILQTISLFPLLKEASLTDWINSHASSSSSSSFEVTGKDFTSFLSSLLEGEASDYRNLFRFSSKMGKIPFIKNYSTILSYFHQIFPHSQASKQSNDSERPSELPKADQIRQLLWLEAIQSFYVLFIDGSFVFYSSNQLVSSQYQHHQHHYHHGTNRLLFTPMAKTMNQTPKKQQRFEEEANKEEETGLSSFSPAAVTKQPHSGKYNNKREEEEEEEEIQYSLSERIYFISQVAYPVSSHLSTASSAAAPAPDLLSPVAPVSSSLFPAVYECNEEGHYVSPYITMKDLKEYCDFSANLEKKISKSSLIINAKNVDEISKIVDILSIDEFDTTKASSLPVASSSVSTSTSSSKCLLLFTTRHFMESYDHDPLSSSKAEGTSSSNAGETSEKEPVSPSSSSASNPFLVTYSLAKITIYRNVIDSASTEENESQHQEKSMKDTNPLTTPQKKSSSSSSVLAPILAPSLLSPPTVEIQIRINESYNIHCFEENNASASASSSSSSQEERLQSKLIVYYDSTREETMILTSVHSIITCSTLSFMKEKLFQLDLTKTSLSSSILPSFLLPSSLTGESIGTNVSAAKEKSVLRLLAMNSSYFHIFQSIEQQQGEEGELSDNHHHHHHRCYLTRILRIPLSLSLFQKQIPSSSSSNNSTKFLYYDSQKRSIILPIVSQAAISLEYENSSVSSSSSSSSSHHHYPHLTMKQPIQELVIPLPKQLLYSFYGNEAFFVMNLLQQLSSLIDSTTVASTTAISGGKINSHLSSSSSFLQSYLIRKLNSSFTIPLLLVLSSKQNYTIVSAGNDRKNDLSSAAVVNEDHKNDYIACIIGRRKPISVHPSSASSSSSSASTTGSSISSSFHIAMKSYCPVYSCSSPELWIYNLSTKRWRNTTLIIGLKESKAKLIKNIPAIDYRLLLAEEEISNSMDPTTTVTFTGIADRQTKNISSSIHGSASLSKSLSFGQFDSSQHNLYLSSNSEGQEEEEDRIGMGEREGEGEGLTKKGAFRVPSIIVPSIMEGKEEDDEDEIFASKTPVSLSNDTRPPLRKKDQQPVKQSSSQDLHLSSAIFQPARQRSESESSKSSDRTDITTSTGLSSLLTPSNAVLPPSFLPIPGSSSLSSSSSTITAQQIMKRKQQQNSQRNILRSSIETTVTTPTAASSVSTTTSFAFPSFLPSNNTSNSSSSAVHSNNQLMTSFLQIISLTWFNTHTIILLTLRKSIYYIEILSREIMKDIYYQTSTPTGTGGSGNTSSGGGGGGGGGGFNVHSHNYSVQSKLHKLIPLPIGFIPIHFDVLTILYPSSSTLASFVSSSSSTTAATLSGSVGSPLIRSTSSLRLQRSYSSEKHHRPSINQPLPERSVSDNQPSFSNPNSFRRHSLRKEQENNTNNSSSDPTFSSVIKSNDFAAVVVSDGKNFISYQVNARFLLPSSNETGTILTIAKQRIIENYSFVELWNFTLDEVVIPLEFASWKCFNTLQSVSSSSSHHSGLPIKTMKAYCQHSPVNGK
jgi:hypothetical protein